MIAEILTEDDRQWYDLPGASDTTSAAISFGVSCRVRGPGLAPETMSPGAVCLVDGLIGSERAITELLKARHGVAARSCRAIAIGRDRKAILGVYVQVKRTVRGRVRQWRFVIAQSGYLTNPCAAQTLVPQTMSNSCIRHESHLFTLFHGSIRLHTTCHTVEADLIRP